MSAFVLVHSPLVGPATWAGVAEVLRRDGHRVVVPSLLRVMEAGPPFTGPAVAAVVAAVGAAGIEGQVVLAGHSGAGPLLPALGAALAGRAACHLFVDAGLPIPGRSRLHDLHPSLRARLAELVRPDGSLPPWDEWWRPGAVQRLLPDPERREEVVAEIPSIPHALFDEVLPEVPGWPSAPCAYLRLSQTYAVEEAAASALGWPVSSLDGGHLELVNAPERVARALVQLLERAVGR